MLRRGSTGSQYESRTLPSCACRVCLSYENSRLRESDRDRIAFRKRTQPAPMTGMGDLRKHLPALAEHLPDVSVHLLHAEESLPVVGSVPTSLVGERFDLHSKPSPEYLARNRTSRFSLRSELDRLYQGLQEILPEPQSCVPRPMRRANRSRPPSGGVIRVKISVLIGWIS